MLPEVRQEGEGEEIGHLTWTPPPPNLERSGENALNSGGVCSRSLSHQGLVQAEKKCSAKRSEDILRLIITNVLLSLFLIVTGSRYLRDREDEWGWSGRGRKRRLTFPANVAFLSLALQGNITPFPDYTHWEQDRETVGPLELSFLCRCSWSG